MKKIILCIIICSSSLMKAQGNEIKILSLNTALLAILAGQVEYGMKQNYRRAEVLSRTILAMSDAEKPDVIVGQEAFDPHATKKLAQGLKSEYPFQWRDTRRGALFLGVNSGLIIFSRLPLHSVTQEDFVDFAGDGIAARKGIVGAKIEVDNKALWIFTAHLQAGISDSRFWKALGTLRRPYSSKTDRETANQIRLLQFMQAKQLIERTALSEEPVIFTGDFNTPAQDSTEFLHPQTQQPLQRNKTMEVVFGADIDTFNGLPDEGSEWNNTPSKRIDYSLHLQSKKDVTVTSIIDSRFTKENPKITDHKGLMTTVTY